MLFHNGSIPFKVECRKNRVRSGFARSHPAFSDLFPLPYACGDREGETVGGMMYTENKIRDASCFYLVTNGNELFTAPFLLCEQDPSSKTVLDIEPARS